MTKETTMTKDEMIDKVIQRYGFENEKTIWFCQLAEELTESQLFNAYLTLMAMKEMECE